MSNQNFYVTDEISQYLLTSANHAIHITLNIIFPSILLNIHDSEKRFKQKLQILIRSYAMYSFSVL
jgi:hypothetical protein